MYLSKAKRHNKSGKLFRYPKRYPKCDLRNIDLRNPKHSYVTYKHIAGKFWYPKEFLLKSETFGYVFRISERLFGYDMTPWLNEPVPAGIFDVDSTLNRRQKSVEKCKNISKKRWNLDVDSTSSNRRRYYSTVFYSASKKRRKSIENSTLIRRRINVEILTVPAGL